MAQFITTAFSDGNDIGLQLGNEEWVRKMAIGSTWTHVRIGLLFQLTGTATIVLGATTGFALGMCSGTSSPFGSTSTTNFVGVRTTGSIGFTSAAPNNYYSYASTNVFACKKVVATVTDAATNLADGSGICTPTTAGTARRGLLYIDITKGSPSYSIGITGFTAGAGANAVDFTVTNLLAGMTQALGSISVGAGGVASQGNGVQSLTCDETAGGFDTVNLYNNGLANPMLIFEVAVEKLS